LGHVGEYFVSHFSEAAGYYGLFAFLALFILPAVAVAPSLVPWFYLIGNLGALVGGIAAAAMLDRVGRKVTVPAFYTLAALGVLLGNRPRPRRRARPRFMGLLR
jgi:MFS family permease